MAGRSPTGRSRSSRGVRGARRPAAKVSGAQETPDQGTRREPGETLPELGFEATAGGFDGASKRSPSKAFSAESDGVCRRELRSRAPVRAPLWTHSSDRRLEHIEEASPTRPRELSQPETGQARARMQLEQAPALERAEALGEPSLDPSVRSSAACSGWTWVTRSGGRQGGTAPLSRSDARLGLAPKRPTGSSRGAVATRGHEAERDPADAGESLGEPLREGGQALA